MSQKEGGSCIVPPIGGDLLDGGMERIAVIVLAAGQGKRMKSDLPKVLTSTVDKPLICHTLSAVSALQPEQVAIVVGHGAALVEEAVTAARNAGELCLPNVSFPRQEAQRGTGDAARSGLPSLRDFSGTVIIICGDTPLVSSETLSAMITAHRRECAVITLLSAVVPEPEGYGRIIRDASGDRVKKITECRDCSPDERVVQEINTGVYAVDADFLTGALSRITNENAQGEYYLTDIVEQAALAGKKVRAFPVFDSDEWLGVNTYLDLYRVNQVLLRRRIEQLLLSGVNILDPRSVIVGERVVIESGVTIGPNTQLLGATNLRRGCFLEGNSYLKDTTVEGGAVVKFCVRAERAIIGTNASVGPFAHLRPGSVLKESVKVGNFVETKNAELGANSSAGHLTYLGDCTIGERVNIGAGTITCNYDGFKKHHTIIEDDCFIGSDTCLIAPLSVGHKSTVGAGSVISADVPANSLALTRPPVTVRRDYVRKERRR